MDAIETPPTKTRGPGKRVLVVDDSMDTARMMKLLLKKAGFEVATAFDGPEALRAASDSPPDFVLLDLTLPTMGGVEVAETIRRTEGLGHALIIAVSGHGKDTLPDPSPFDHHLLKPVDHDRLIEVLTRTPRGAASPDPAGTFGDPRKGPAG